MKGKTQYDFWNHNLNPITMWREYKSDQMTLRKDRQSKLKPIE